MNFVINKQFEGRMGRTLRPVYIILVGGKEVGSSKRRWLAYAIGRAIEAGLIQPTGDTTMAYTKWCSEHDRAVYERIIASGE